MFHPGIGNEGSCYVDLMANIIDRDKDVHLLRSLGIIQVNVVGSEEILAKLFNSLPVDVPVDLCSDDVINRVRREAAAYTRKQWNHWRTNFRHTYFNNPWTALSLFAAMHSSSWTHHHHSDSIRYLPILSVNLILVLEIGMADIKRGENHWVVELLGQLSDRLREQEEKWKQHSIYKLPARVTDLNPNAYKPRVVSFGPYHHDDQHLFPMEAHKQRAMIRFIKRSSARRFYLCFDDADAFLQELKASYDSLGQKWEENPDAFMELMIRDGCFMLEILLHNFQENHEGPSSSYAENDPIFGNKVNSMMPNIRRDMLMLENQLPMSLLIKLLPFGCPTVQGDLNEKINTLIIEFYVPGNHRKHLGYGKHLGQCKHVLDVYRKTLLLDPSHTKVPTMNNKESEILTHGTDQKIDQLPPATRLHEAGIKIVKGKSKNLGDVSFDKGVLTLPALMVDGNTEPVYLNLIAYEMFHHDIGNEVASYVALMDDIIDSDKDVDILRCHGIITVNAVGSDDILAKLFNTLSKDVPLDLYSNNPVNIVRRKAAAYTREPWNKWLGNLRHTYFKNPWTAISLIAAIVLLGLTIVQTVYTIGQYYQ
ncbi:OLC1v1028168C1 [Oldenlandia corymbosa var. corymbosa]|uniref:OLC1v1028168C1 n=1 Tax=Oldenlandia corymbosa var. corymbosa TaxID=529605 RepID=A0AAV1CCY1_OLDCO|nr:OLC1v1028168C1 [Oldenlandia corymbosa var. corymbosa]